MPTLLAMTSDEERVQVLVGKVVLLQTLMSVFHASSCVEAKAKIKYIKKALKRRNVKS